jgi:hypothetical protein
MILDSMGALLAGGQKGAGRAGIIDLTHDAVWNYDVDITEKLRGDAQTG